MSKITVEKQYGSKTESQDKACHCEIGGLLFNVKIPCGSSHATFTIKKENSQYHEGMDSLSGYDGTANCNSKTKE